MDTLSTANSISQSIKAPKGAFLVGKWKTQQLYAYKERMGSTGTLLQNLRKNKDFKKQDDLGLEDVPFERELVNFVDNLIAVAKKNDSKDVVAHDKDWDTIKYIYRGFTILYPRSHKDFEQKMGSWKDAIKEKTVVREGEAMIQHKMEVPMPLYKMIQTIFPMQRWDGPFVNKLATVLPVLSAGRHI